MDAIYSKTIQRDYMNTREEYEVYVLNLKVLRHTTYHKHIYYYLTQIRFSLLLIAYYTIDDIVFIVIKKKRKITKLFYLNVII